MEYVPGSSCTIYTNRDHSHRRVNNGGKNDMKEDEKITLGKVEKFRHHHKALVGNQ